VSRIRTEDLNDILKHSILNTSAPGI